MRKIAFFTFLIGVFFLVSCKNEKTKSDTVVSNDTTELLSGKQFYTGTIDGKYNIVMYLNIDGQINGKYFYEGHKEEMILIGMLNDKNEIELTEYNVKGKKTGSFSGIMEDDKISGIWKNDDKQFDFELTKTDKSYEELKTATVLSKIKNDDFKEFLINYAEADLPITFGYPEYMENVDGFIEPSLVKRFIDESYEGETDFTYGFCMDCNGFVMLMSPGQFIPGVGGVYDTYYYISTLTYNGDLLYTEEVGGEYVDNDADITYVTSSSVTIDENLNITTVEESYTQYVNTDEVTDTSTEIVKFSIDDSGFIKKIENKSDTVTTPDELVEAINDNKKIYVKSGDYRMWETADELPMMIVSLQNVEIIGVGDSKPRILINDPYSFVVNIEESRNIKFTNITFGHDVNGAECEGTVIDINLASNISFENCDLFGSGTYGINAVNVAGIECSNTIIHDCTTGIISFDGVENASFNNCEFVSNGEFYMFDLTNSKDISIHSCRIADNFTSFDLYSLFSLMDCENVSLTNSVLENNAVARFCEPEDGLIEADNTYLNNDWQ